MYNRCFYVSKHLLLISAILLCLHAPLAAMDPTAPSRNLNEDLVSFAQWVYDQPVASAIALAGIGATGGVPASAALAGGYLLSKLPSASTSAIKESKDLLQEGDKTLFFVNDVVQSLCTLARVVKEIKELSPQEAPANPQEIQAIKDKGHQQLITTIEHAKGTITETKDLLENMPQALVGVENILVQLRKIKQLESQEEPLSQEDWHSRKEMELRQLHLQCEQLNAIASHMITGLRETNSALPHINKVTGDVARIIELQNSVARTSSDELAASRKASHEYMHAQLDLLTTLLDRLKEPLTAANTALGHGEKITGHMAAIVEAQSKAPQTPVVSLEELLKRKELELKHLQNLSRELNTLATNVSTQAEPILTAANTALDHGEKIAERIAAIVEAQSKAPVITYDERVARSNLELKHLAEQLRLYDIFITNMSPKAESILKTTGIIAEHGISIAQALNPPAPAGAQPLSPEQQVILANSSKEKMQALSTAAEHVATGCGHLSTGLKSIETTLTSPALPAHITHGGKTLAQVAILSALGIGGVKLAYNKLSKDKVDTKDAIIAGIGGSTALLSLLLTLQIMQAPSGQHDQANINV